MVGVAMAKKKTASKPRKKAAKKLIGRADPNWSLRKPVPNRFDTEEIVRENIRDLLEIRGLTYTAFGRLLNMDSRASASKLMRGVKPISVDMLDEIAWVLGVKPDELVVKGKFKDGGK